MAKNIVLLSDGTGQRGGVGHQSNVWRLYQALEHDDAQQIRCYDDGVGSQDFAIVKAIGGAFGFGLKGKVCNLYAFLARHYEPEDRIFLFGFSRGAFTVRLLAGMIAKCGLIDPQRCDSEADYWHKVRAAYCAYRQSYFAAGYAAKFKADYGRRDQTDVPIRFLGVWDTVDAMGVPFDELRDAIDGVLRYNFRDNTLSNLVEHGCHAVALDECRKAFDPVMWDERLETCRRIEQVWFAGVHSNVGGGYPKYQMSLVTLDWMIERARVYGLRVREEEVQNIRRAADVHGKLYDSRRGAASYYRYRPRDLAQIRNEYTHGPLHLHASALARIDQATDRYAPHNLCEMTLVQPGHGRLHVNDAWRQAMKFAKCVSWLRAVMYFLLLVTTALVFVVPWFITDSFGACREDLQLPFKVLQWFTPGIACPWINGLDGSPYIAALVGALLVFLLVTHQGLKKWHLNLASAGWHAVRPDHRPAAGDTLARAERSRLLRWAHNMRHNRTLRFARRLSAGMFVRALTWLLWFPLKIGRRVNQYFCLRKTTLAGGFDGTLNLAQGERCDITFLTKDPHRSTGVYLQAGETYEIRVDAAAGWYDDQFPADPTGLADSDAARALERRVERFLRVRNAPLFALIAQIEGDKSEYVQIGRGRRFTPTASGQLFLFVNDAIIPAFGAAGFMRDIFYHNNRGIAFISVHHVLTDPAPHPLLQDTPN